MVDFKVVLSDPATGKAYNIDASGAGAGSFIGKRIGDEIDGSSLGFEGYKIQITGASDRNGTPARKSLPIAGRRKVLMAGGIGFHPRVEGERRRKMVRGAEITQDFVQINAKVTSQGSKSLAAYFAPPEPETPAAE
ncbi:30S ribosomal protein S6e [Methanospirillum sp. J.3.6.1-F.2.7.3]|jgi:small subunit ribosomal protein S6e|uniref:Small ribosomal subunit protein eS6 n=2 Tax=Methanospirillum TaxID=2202 RepID=A0A8E7EJZ9_9EURY|nr:MULTISPECIES: 30S ribosomal protein S6e [Methanospirillum]MDX8549597.1 30S ribosomal protein S6e [Methanospirillum hungatei]NLW76252.1 30S ribosomal protein S6e [Methanomicrobiales archaeon]QVV88980.1 30S ribosomal protein S6e [Methanospirillum sp. J.3.6.1-F.2.7.3]QXO93687.1 30S ribosomal protein S6e [Methanospirillum hungatei]